MAHKTGWIVEPEHRSVQESLEVKVGKPFKVDFRNIAASTGYEWSQKSDSTAFQLLKEDIKPGRNFDIRLVRTSSFPYIALSRELVIGAPGKITYHFMPLREGRYEIEFELKKAWEKKPIETRRYNVIVK